MGDLKRNRSIDAVKGLAILLVMLGHVFVHNHMEDPYLYDLIKAVQMPLFMIVSGYLCGQGRKIEDLKTYGEILKKRGISYLVPFFSWLTLMHLEDLFAAYRRVFFELDFGLWFLAVLFILTVMVYTAQLLCAPFRKKSAFWTEVVFWIIYGAECLVLVVQILKGNTFLSPYLTILYVPFYMLGYLAGNYGKVYFSREQKSSERISFCDHRLLRGGILLAGAVFLYLIIAKDLNSMESRLDTLIQMIASFLGCFVLIYGIFSLKDGKIKRVLAWLGGYTLEIYVIHYHFANILNFKNQTYDFYTPEGFLFVLASFVAMSAVTFSFIYVIKRVKILNFVLFGKRK